MSAVTCPSLLIPHIQSNSKPCWLYLLSKYRTWPLSAFSLLPPVAGGPTIPHTCLLFPTGASSWVPGFHPCPIQSTFCSAVWRVLWKYKWDSLLKIFHWLRISLKEKAKVLTMATKAYKVCPPIHVLTYLLFLYLLFTLLQAGGLQNVPTSVGKAFPSEPLLNYSLYFDHPPPQVLISMFTPM